MTDRPLGIDHDFDSDYFGWTSTDVEWERPPPAIPPAFIDLPVVSKTVPDHFPRLTGQELFDRMTKVEQDELLGSVIAQAVRDGKVTLKDLVVYAPMETEPDFIRQATPEELGLGPQ